jgi:hypothetical protein
MECGTSDIHSANHLRSDVRLSVGSPEQLLLDGHQAPFDHLTKSRREGSAGTVRVHTHPVYDKAECDRRRLDNHLPGIREGVEVSHGSGVSDPILAAALGVTHRIIGEKQVVAPQLTVVSAPPLKQALERM